MRVEIVADNMEVTPKVRGLVNEKIGLSLEKHLPSLNEEIKTATVRISKNPRWGYETSFEMSLPKKYKIYAKMRHERLLSVLVRLRDQATRQIKVYKRKL